MQVVLIILSVILLGAIIRFALSPKSSRPLKLAALGALILIGLAIGICAVILLRGPKDDQVNVPLAVLMETAPTPERNTNLPAIIGFLAVFLVLLALIIYSAQRSRLKQEDEPAKTVVRKKVSLSSILPPKKEPEEKKPDSEEDSFELDI